MPYYHAAMHLRAKPMNTGERPVPLGDRVSSFLFREGRAPEENALSASAFTPDHVSRVVRQARRRL